MEQILRRLDDIECTIQTRFDELFEKLASNTSSKPECELRQSLKKFTNQYIVSSSEYVLSRNAFRMAFTVWLSKEAPHVEPKMLLNSILDDHFGVASHYSKVVSSDVYEFLTKKKSKKPKDTIVVTPGWKGIALSKEICAPSVVVNSSKKLATRKEQKTIEISDGLRQVLLSKGLEPTEQVLSDISLIEEICASLPEEVRENYIEECKSGTKQ